MRPARRDTRTDILDLAERLFHDRGFNGFSYADIAGELGIKSAAVHYHFPSKTDLGVALIERIRAFIQYNLHRLETEDRDPAAAIEAYCQYYRQHLCQERHSICAVGLLAAELTTMSEEMRAQARGLAADVHTLITRVLEQGLARGVMRFTGQPAERAVAVMSALGGAAQYARLADNPDYLETTITQIRRDLGLFH